MTIPVRVRVTRVIVNGQACNGQGKVTEKKRKRICRSVALEILGPHNPTYAKWKALHAGAELKYGVRTYIKGEEAMEEKLLASLAGRKKANASRLLRRKESGGKRAAATKVDVEIRQGHKDASQKPADDVTISVILDSDHSSNHNDNVLHSPQDDVVHQDQEQVQLDK